MSAPIPRVSVIMTVYNGARHLAEAVDSILSQTLTDFELIIVDDVSSDETPQMLEDYASRDPRVRIMRNDRNLGPYPSANRALEVARAPIIARMDADDICLPDRLARQAQFLERNPDHLLVGGGYLSIDGEGRPRYVKLNPMDWRAAAWTTRLRMPMVHPSFCFRAVLPDGTPVRYGEDFPIAQDFALAAKMAGAGRIASLSGILVHYRMHAGNISTKRADDQNSFAAKVAATALAGHYPAQIAAQVGFVTATLYKRREPNAACLAAAARGLRAAIAYDDDGSPGTRRWMRRRAAGVLAEAFVAGAAPRKAVMALWFIVRAPDFLVPLMMRLLEVKGKIAQHPAPIE